ncbi:hypothetical protein FDB92_19615 [Clostridium butyricum]|nr:hypothetical protein [Clostridium butyricum]
MFICICFLKHIYEHDSIPTDKKHIERYLYKLLIYFNFKLYVATALIIYNTKQKIINTSIILKIFKILNFSLTILEYIIQNKKIIPITFKSFLIFFIVSLLFYIVSHIICYHFFPKYHIIFLKFFIKITFVWLFSQISIVYPKIYSSNNLIVSKIIIEFFLYI